MIRINSIDSNEMRKNIVNFKILTETEQHKYDNEILNMLIGGDDEFVPPLSTRTSTTQSDLTGSCDGNNGVQLGKVGAVEGNAAG